MSGSPRRQPVIWATSNPLAARSPECRSVADRSRTGSSSGQTVPLDHDSGLNAIVRVDSGSREVRRFSLPPDRPNVNLKTAAFDGHGVLWFTGQAGFYGRIDPRTGDVRVSMHRAGGDRTASRRLLLAMCTTPHWPATTSPVSRSAPARRPGSNRRPAARARVGCGRTVRSGVGQRVRRRTVGSLRSGVSAMARVETALVRTAGVRGVRRRSGHRLA